MKNLLPKATSDYHNLTLTPDIVLKQHMIVDFSDQKLDEMIKFALKKKWISDKIKVKRRYSFAKNRLYSYGIKENNNIGLVDMAYIGFWLDNPPYTMPEYDHIKKDKEIGSLPTFCWKQALLVDLAHEFAHVVDLLTDVEIPQNAYKKAYSFSEKNPEHLHGASWQYFYRILRKKFVNHSKISYERTKQENNFSVRIHDGKRIYDYFYDKNDNFIGIIRFTKGKNNYDIIFDGKLYNKTFNKRDLAIKELINTLYEKL